MEDRNKVRWVVIVRGFTSVTCRCVGDPPQTRTHDRETVHPPGWSRQAHNPLPLLCKWP